jgi:SAM-dependent methyltransferase
MTVQTKQATPKPTWYDFPEYYDMGFREDTPREVRFFKKAFQHYCRHSVKSVLEPGCGSGRLIHAMAAQGFRVTGIDLNRNALDYCQSRLDKRGLTAGLIQGDMTDFAFKKPFDAAFNTINTFRHLLNEQAAAKHLRCVATALKPGGIYILGLHLLPPDADLYGTERWTATRGKTKVNYSLTVKKARPKERLEDLRITMTIRRGEDKPVRVSDEFTLRTYSHRQLKSLFASVSEFELADIFDFWYDIREPQPFDQNLVDAVFILRKKS